EHVELYEQRAKFELTEREQKINEQLSRVISDRSFKEETLKRELHSIKLQLTSTINHNKSMVEEVSFLKKDFKQKENKHIADFLDMKTLKEKVEDKLIKQDQSLQMVHMLCRPRPNPNELNRVAIGYKNPLCLTRAKQVQPALYNGHEIIKDNHKLTIVHDTEDTLETAKITRKKINDKMNNPECVTRKVKIAPHDYSKDNLLATFTPQKQLTPKQIFWSNDLMKLKSEALKEWTKVSRPIKVFTVKATVNPQVFVRDKHAIDVEPIVPRLRKNKDAHLDYLRHLKESVETIRDIVEEAKVTTDSHINKLIDQVTHLQAQNDLFRAENDKIKQHYKELKKQVTVAKPSDKSDSTTHPHVVTVKSQKTNVPVPPSTGVNNKMADSNAPFGQTPAMVPPLRADDQILPHIRTPTSSGPLQLPPPYPQYTSNSSGIRSYMTRKLDATAVSWTNNGKKRATLIVIPSIRFTKMIIHHLQRRLRFHPRPDFPLHLANEEPVLRYLKFNANGTKREVFGMPIPVSLITVEIQQASYYREYLAKVDQYKRYLANETGGVQDPHAPKPTPPARKPKTTAPKAPSRPSVLIPSNSEEESEKVVLGAEEGGQDEDIPQQVSIAISEVVTDAVDWAMQAPLRNRFRDLPGADMKEILHQRMWEPKSYKSHKDHMQLFKALEKSMNHDHSEELTQDLAEARKKKKNSRKSPKTPPGSPSHQPPLPPPPAGPSGASRAPGAFGSSQVPPSPPPPSSTNQESPSKGSTAPSPSKIAASAEYQAWTTTDIRLRSSISLTPADLKWMRIWLPTNKHNRRMMKTSGVPIFQQHQLWRLIIHPPEDSLLAQTGDIATFIDWFCKKRGITELKPQDLEGPAYEIIEVFHPDVIHLQYQMEECHKLLTDSVDDPILRHNVSKPLPLGGPPEQMVPDQFWIEEECKYDIAVMSLEPPPTERKEDSNYDRQPMDRQLVIRQRVEDFQLGIESYQTQLNLTKPQWDATDYEYKHDYTVIDSPRAAIFRDKYGVRMMMRVNEIHKFSDGTLHQIDKALDYRIKEFRINRMNPGLNTRFQTRKDVDQSKAVMFAIQRRLKTRRIFRSLESFVGGRVREGDYRLLNCTE
nr:integrase, catalytic region, zinc finger, CCHC-type, peptidase aspartic, catalytic [Tanacetum cinerariifolium]